MTTDNMPPHDWTVDTPDETGVKVWGEASMRAYAEQQSDENFELRAILAHVTTALGTGAFCSSACSLEFLKMIPAEVSKTIKAAEQQTAELIAEKAILEKASSDNFALYYEAKRDRKELRAQVEELKAKIHCQDTYILELLTKLKDKQ